MTHRDMFGPCAPFPFGGHHRHIGKGCQWPQMPPFPHSACFSPAPHVIHDEGEEVVITIPVPGYGKDEVELTLKGHFLVVKGNRESAAEEKGETDLEDHDIPPEQEPNENHECDESPEGSEWWAWWGRKFLRQVMPPWDLWNQDKFEVSVPVPPVVDTEAPVKAQVQKGLLKVTFQKKQGKEVPIE